MFSHIYFFIKSTFSIPVSTGKMKNKLSRFGELNYPSFFPASRSQFLISPLSNSYATFHTQGEFNFEFSLEILFSIPCCINSSMPLQSLCGWVPKSLGFSKQEHWNGLPFPSPMHGSEKWKWSHSVVSDSQRPHGLQPTRILHPWDFPGKSTGVRCHCLLWRYRATHPLSPTYISQSPVEPRLVRVNDCYFKPHSIWMVTSSSC